MISKLYKNIIQKPYLLLLIMLCCTHMLSAGEYDRYIIISGQIVNYEYGNPVSNHTVFITSDASGMDRSAIYFELVSNEEGFYYDTIYTTSNNGSLFVYTYDYNGLKVDTTVHFRFMGVTSNTLIANFQILMPYQIQKLQARFKHYQIAPENRFTFQFIDQTLNEYIISWRWDFGDGHTSSLPNPSHTFAEPGLYKITLTLRSEQYGVTETSVNAQQIYISDRAYYHMGGHAFAGNFPIDDGLAFLYSTDSLKKTHIIDTCLFDTLGYYYFYQVPEGEYIVKTQPQKSSDFYGSMLPTYYGDQIFWNLAEVIKHDHTDWEYNIRLAEGKGLSLGNCTISGQVVFDSPDRNGDSIPAQGVDIYLFNQQDEQLVSHYSDELGLFDFSSIEVGTYWLYPEVTGQLSDRFMVEVTHSHPEIADIIFIIQPTEINLIMPEQGGVFASAISALYPNPSTDHINIDIMAAQHQLLELEVYDMMGRLRERQYAVIESGGNTLSIPTSNLESGIYVLRVVSDGQVSEQRFVVNR